jgi:hypothetical protein
VSDGVGNGVGNGVGEDSSADEVSWDTPEGADDSWESAEDIENFAASSEVLTRGLLRDAHELNGAGDAGAAAVSTTIEALVHAVIAMTHQARADAMRARVHATDEGERAALRAIRARRPAARILRAEEREAQTHTE